MLKFSEMKTKTKVLSGVLMCSMLLGAAAPSVASAVAKSNSLGDDESEESLLDIHAEYLAENSYVQINEDGSMVTVHPDGTTSPYTDGFITVLNPEEAESSLTEILSLPTYYECNKVDYTESQWEQILKDVESGKAIMAGDMPRVSKEDKNQYSEAEWEIILAEIEAGIVGWAE